MWECRLNPYGSEYGPIAWSFVHGNKNLGFKYDRHFLTNTWPSVSKEEFPTEMGLWWNFCIWYCSVSINSGVGTLTSCYWDLLRVAFSAFFMLEMAVTDPKRILAVTWTRLCVDEPPLAPVYPEDRPCPWLTPPPKLCPWAYEEPLLLLLASLARQDLQPSGILPTLQCRWLVERNSKHKVGILESA
jgi:hypothetical protein